jgi:hypothetical protein
MISKYYKQVPRVLSRAGLLIPLAFVCFLTERIVIDTEIERFKSFGFEDAIASSHYGTFHARLLGTDTKENDTTTVRGGPYQLLISWKPSASYQQCHINIRAINLSSRASSIAAIAAFGTGRARDEDGTTIFSFPNTWLPYEMQLLHLNAALECPRGCLPGSSQQLLLMMEPKFDERKITLWDKLMGI